MAVVPTGSPAWSRTASFAIYGGHVNKENYLGKGAIDALTDVAAEEFSRAVSDQAAAVRTAPFAIITYLCNDSSPAAPTVECVFMMTGVRLTSYGGGFPPAGFPSAARNGNGDVTFTFASSYTDEYGISESFAPRHAETTAHGIGAGAREANFSISGQTVRVAVVDDSGAGVQDPRVTLVVY